MIYCFLSAFFFINELLDNRSTLLQAVYFIFDAHWIDACHDGINKLI